MNVVYKKFISFATQVYRVSDQINLVRYRRQEPIVDYRRSCFVYYPRRRFVTNRPDTYRNLRSFFIKDKHSQRERLSNWFNVPIDAGYPKILRPLRHKGAEQYFVIANEEELREVLQYIEFEYYTQTVFPKKKEYRVIYIYGEPLICLLKKNLDETEELDPALPWNGTNTYFTTININTCNLTRTSFFEDARRFFQELPFDVVAFDVGWRINNRIREYKLFEVNFAPGLAIEDNIELIAQKVAEGRNNV